jgi:hypothetical protein
MTKDPHLAHWRRFFAELRSTLDQARNHLWMDRVGETDAQITAARARVLEVEEALAATEAPRRLVAPPVAVPDGRAAASPPPVDVQMEPLDILALVGPLAAALQISDTPTRRTAMAALVKLLPYVSNETRGLLNAHQEAMLCRELGLDLSITTADLKIAIIKALEQAGGERSLRSIRHAARQDAYGPAAQRVRETARAVYPEIQARLAREQSGNVLLRPARDPERADRLLRPARGTTPGDDGSLLRPSEEQPGGKG